MKKIFTLFLVFTMLVVMLLPVTSLAADGDTAPATSDTPQTTGDTQQLTSDTPQTTSDTPPTTGDSPQPSSSEDTEQAVDTETPPLLHRNIKKSEGKMVSNNPVCLPDVPSCIQKHKPDKSYVESLLSEGSEYLESSASLSADSVTSQSLASLNPKIVTIDLKWDEDNGSYSKQYYYDAPSTGIYSFVDLNTTQLDSDIYIYDMSGNEVASDGNIMDSFSLVAFLNGGYKYKIRIDNITKSKDSFLLSTPSDLGDTAYTLKSNGYAYSWYQSFNINVPTDDIYSFHVTCPKNCEYNIYIYDSDLKIYYSWSFNNEMYDFMEMPPGNYYMLLSLTNYSSKSDTYSIAMDAEGSKHMDSGVPVNTTLATNDTLTTNAFGAEITGKYKFTCNRNDARLSLYSFDAEGYTVNNVSPGSSFSMTKDDAFMVFISTNGSSGGMTYSIDYLSPDSSLSDISTSIGSLSPAFSSATNRYTLSLDSDAVSSVKLTPKPTAPGGVMRINGTNQNNITVPITSSTSQYVTVNYTSSDGTTNSTYSVHVRSMEQTCFPTGTSYPFISHSCIAYCTVENDYVPQPIDLSVCGLATWNLYSDENCTSVITDHTIIPLEGLNRAYLKVTAEDGHHNAVYPVLMYRVSSSINPVLIAYDTNYHEISNNAVLTGTVHVIPLGQETLKYTVKKDGSDFSWNGIDVFTTDGAYTVNLTDGNEHKANTLNFTIDNTPPVITAKDAGNASVLSGALINKDVIVKLDDLTLDTHSAKKDGSDYTWPVDNKFTEDGSFVITAKDKFNRTATFSFTIDKTAPVITATPYKRTALADGGHTNASYVTVAVTGNSSKPTATRNGYKYSWPSKSRFSSSGVYVITVKDTAGNVATFSFTIDNTKPTITAKAGTKTIKNKASTNKSVTVTVKDTNLAPAYPTVTEDGALKTWPSDGLFKEEGKYVVTAKDKSGNTSTFTFTIDLKPSLDVTMFIGGAAVNNKAIINDSVHVTYSDKFMKSKTLTKNGKTIKWPTETIPHQFDLTADGVYVITLKDKYGNKTPLTFTIDKTKPVIKATPYKGKALADNGYTNKSYVTVSISDLTKITAKSVTKDGSPITYPKDGKFSKEGKYVITATDSLSHTSSFTFTIDRAKLSISAKDKSGKTVGSGGYANSDVTVTVKGTSIAPTATKDKVNYEYPAGGVFTEEGTYAITATGYTGKVSTFTFIIDKTPPTITGRASDGYEFSAGYFVYANDFVTVTVSADTASKRVTKDGVGYPYPSDGKFTEDGVYVLYAYDAAGNEAVVHITINRIAPTITVIDKDGGTVIDKGYTNKDYVTVTIGPTASTRVAKKDNKPAYIIPSDVKFTEEGVYLIIAKDMEGNQTEYHFTIDRTAPTISATLESDETTPVSDEQLLNANVKISASDTVTTEYYMVFTVKKNGSVIPTPSNLTLGDEGSYSITATDRAGNTSAAFTFTIDKTGPTITAANEDGAVANYGYSNKQVTVTVGSDNVELWTYFNGGTCDFGTGVFSNEVEGYYEFVAHDSLGNQTYFKFTIDTEAPRIELLTKDMLDLTGVNNINTKVRVYANDNFSSALTLKITKDGSDYYYAENWNGSESPYLIEDEGVFAITVTDQAGNSTTSTITIDRTAPLLTAVLASDGTTVVSEGDTVTDPNGVTLSFIEPNLKVVSVKKDTFFEIKRYPLGDESDESMLWDGTSPITLTDNGAYSVDIIDQVENKTTLTFTINHA